MGEAVSGGDGFALPAGICNFNSPVTFFAIVIPFYIIFSTCV
jgi:hypothetical protein